MAKFSRFSKLKNNIREDLLFNFFRALASCKKPREVAELLTDLLSGPELEMVSKRLGTAKALLENQTYQSIKKNLNISDHTIARISLWLANSGEGIRTVLKRVKFTASAKKIYKKAQKDNLGLHDIKKMYPQYFWPQLLLEKIVSNASKKEREELRTIIRLSKEKNQLHRRLKLLLKTPIR